MITPSDYSPMRPGAFKRWLLVWHVLYIGGLLVALGVVLWESRGAWSWRELALIPIVAILIALYLRVLVFIRRWPHPLPYLAAYYAIVLALLAAAVWVSPVFIWAIGMLFGQMFGVLPPRLAIPGVILVLGLILLAANDWRFPTSLDWRDVAIVAVQIVGMVLLYLYIYQVFRTSQERADLVNRLRAAQAELEQARDQQAELAALRERERVARDLHDGLGHSLVALSVQLEAVQRLYPVDPARASAQIDDMKRLTRDSMAELRRTLDNLRAPGLGNEPFDTAIQRLCAGLAARTGLDVQWSISPEALSPPPAIAEALWRVAQEALANVERHAHARSVRLNVSAAPDALAIAIADDGRGLPSNPESLPGHYGLRGMRERVEGLGGSLSLTSKGAGTTVVARLPVVGSKQ